MKKPELLAPAGDFSRLLYAIQYGADAVYLGGQTYSLRTASANFDDAEIKKAVDYAHSKNVRVYVACNTVPRNAEIDAFSEYIRYLYSVGVDAVICTDLGMFRIIKEESPDMEIHISTQANVTNYRTCTEWYNLGAKRIVVARELSLAEISEIRDRCPAELEIEAFVHGAMCMSHSGRCLLSNYLTGRDANRGNCSQPCRWKYYLNEEKRPGEYFPIGEDENGTYIFNSKDLCMIDKIPDLCSAGVDSLKIEGRVKTEYYVACVTGAYRHAIDDCFSDLDKYSRNISAYMEEVCKVSHREYCTGFFFGDNGAKNMNFAESSYIRDYEVSGLITGYDPLTKCIIVRERNKFAVGDVCEVVEADKQPFSFKITEMFDENNNEILAAPHADMTAKVRLDRYVGSMSFLRRKKG